MTHYPYLIIGGGMTGAAAANGIRELDADGRILILTDESEMPYDRPPLSKKLWEGKKQIDDIYVDLPADIEVRTGRHAVSLDADARAVTDDQGDVYTYDRLLLATGGTPRHLPFGGEAVNYYRTLDDYRALRQQAEAGASFVVIGGGFIGSEVAASLTKRGCHVTMIFPEAGVTDRLFPAHLAAFATDSFRERGVEVLSGESVKDIDTSGDRPAVVTGSGRRIEADAIVAGIGIIPNTDLAKQADLTVESGVVVDEFLRTSQPEIYAAGDLASYPDQVLDVRRRVEHADAARAMGRAAGRNMAGADEPYTWLPMFYSDLFDLSYEAVGQFDTRMELVEDWIERPLRGVIYYLRDNRVRGVLLLDVWDRLDEARALIAAGEPVSADTLIGRIR